MGIGTKLNAWLAEFPSTNGKAVAAITLAFLTGARVLTSGVAVGKFTVSELSEGTLLAWLGFIAALAGISAWQYKAKRVTDYRMTAPDTLTTTTTAAAPSTGAP